MSLPASEVRSDYPLAIDDNAIDTIKEFLAAFVAEHSTTEFNLDDSLPISVGFYYVAEQEVKGCCIDWSRRYLITWYNLFYIFILNFYHCCYFLGGGYCPID